MVCYRINNVFGSELPLKLSAELPSSHSWVVKLIRNRNKGRDSSSFTNKGIGKKGVENNYVPGVQPERK